MHLATNSVWNDKNYNRG